MKYLLLVTALVLPLGGAKLAPAPSGTGEAPHAHHRDGELDRNRRPHRFFEPTNPRTGIRLDVCLDFARLCYQPAATYFCRAKGFKRADRYWVEEGRGRGFTTQTGRSKQICRGPNCDAFLAIDCTNRPRR